MICTITDCERIIQATGLCAAHYDRKRYGRPMDEPIQENKRDQKSIELAINLRKNGMTQTEIAIELGVNPSTISKYLNGMPNPFKREPTGRDREKQKLSQHESYLRNKEKVRQNSKTGRDNRKNKINTYKESKACMDCSIYYPYYVMDLDHRDPKLKISSVSQMLSKCSMDKIWAEIDKCDLVCSNCHRIRTYSNGA